MAGVDEQEEVIRANPMVMRTERQSVAKLRQLRQMGSGTGLEDEIGTTGLRQYGGFILEEWLAALQGKRAAMAYREMKDNDPVVGAILFAIDMLARGVRYSLTDGDAQRNEFIEQCMNDMSHTWLDFVSEALSMLPYGWAFHEEVYKRRLGKRPPSLIIPDEGATSETEEDTKWEQADSEFSDGKIGWRKLPIRSQESLLNWDFDGYAGLKGMNQIDFHGGYHKIPIEKALLFRTETTRKNPEGRSILRTAWTSFYRMSNIQQIEAIGVERDLAGIPVAAPPPGTDLNAPKNAEVKQAVEELVRSIRKDEDEGVVLPSTEWELKLLTTGGQRQINTDDIIRRYEQRIASSCLADFVLLGQDALGSFAMVDIKSELFGLAIDTILDEICRVMNQHAIPRLLALNGMKLENPPRLQHSKSGRMDLEKMGRFLQSIALAGGPIPWSKELMGELFDEADLPANYEDSLVTEAQPDGDLHRIGDGTGDEEQGNDGDSGDAPPGGAKEQKNGVRATGPQNDARERTLPKKAEGVVQGISAVMGDRSRLLASQLESEIGGALRDLGIEASTAFLHEGMVEKADNPSQRRIRKAIQKVMQRVNVQGWVRSRLEPILRNHAGRIGLDAQRILQRELGIELHLGDEVMRELADSAGEHLKVADIEPQVQAAIMEAIREGFDSGDNPTVTARRIADAVPAGRFHEQKTRATLIARNETANLQRKATLGLYKSNPRVKAVILRDGVYGPPRSDEACMERAGERVPIDQADSVKPYHPLCTLGFDPEL